MKIDEINMAIIKHLRDGRRSFKNIADNLGLTENTVRSRVKKLMEGGILEISGVVNPESIPRHHTVIIGVKLGTADMFKKAEMFSKLRGIVSVAVVTGRYDLMVTVLFNDDYSLEEFYTEEVSRIEGVQSMETFVIYKNFNLKVPYIL
ncbi:MULTISPECIES: Lrp/AsnC family transcriptional regulator [Desulfococcus]|uniref:Transcriptional regulator, AsnC family n=1 Tax=Desulfococcus multivorans DSM 2059 TaxID=1121405 RepID=S7V1M1_DESML|nr:Lrp/AsnC family transcriptional regulator [Desulfococcus multivorans]AOY57612.1 transcriptional regulator, AsnC family [Desulfococcus multivorans]AQV00020.1 transcriptional regulator [Desulfococcus multivorans]EPR40394.1 transcriptional regulator, AsnC family [Desulfococcus multivorans DSM 2059]SJZ77005.1 Lrp/AsnC family transcriptional regulator, regulator for asnA, asnC and gidA [Desulfococcus multivorans DSM 2059]